jgi:glycosyltransferase involved in cell wall biosynthesis
MRFTIVIPSRNRPSRLRTCLEAIARLDYPHQEFEVVVVDDGSAPPLEDAVMREPLPGPVPVRFLRQGHSGPAIARNLGVSVAVGEWLAFIDDDCVAQRGWLKAIDEAARAHPGSLLGGSIRNGCPDNIYAAANQHLLETVTGWLVATHNSLRFFTTNNMAVNAREFERVDGFNKVFPIAAAEDREFCARWLAAGGTLCRVPSARVDHYHPQSLTVFTAMHFRYGRGAAFLHRSLRSSPVKTFSSGLHAHVFGHLWSGGDPVARKLAISGLLFLAQIVTAAGFAVERLFPTERR